MIPLWPINLDRQEKMRGMSKVPGFEIGWNEYFAARDYF
jgi:hypothetical protein